MVPNTAAALPLCMATAILCFKWWCDWGFPVFACKRDPSSLINERAPCPNTPDVSIATGTKWWLTSSSAYFALFLSSAWLAMAPASLVASITWDAANVSGHVVSQTRALYIILFIYFTTATTTTVQVAMCAYSFVCTLVNVLVLQVKTPPAQVAAGDDDHNCKWSIFASWWKEKHHQRKICIKVVPLCKLHLVERLFLQMLSRIWKLLYLCSLMLFAKSQLSLKLPLKSPPKPPLQPSL